MENPIAKLLSKDLEEGDAPPVPLGGTREEAMQRLQVGVFGLVSMILLVGLANVIMDRAELTEEGAVPGAAATVAADATGAPKSNPLADAGVAPEVLTEPEPAVQPTPAPIEQAEAAPNESE